MYNIQQQNPKTPKPQNPESGRRLDLNMEDVCFLKQAGQNSNFVRIGMEEMRGTRRSLVS
jgi:hypothetical protein